MEWAKDFYTKQVRWWGLDTMWADESLHEVSPEVGRRIALLERLARTGKKRVLELGAGGGHTAAAFAARGHSVVAVEITDVAAANARRLSTEVRGGELAVVQGDFYEVALEGSFDVVCYFDGFGIGSDEEQRQLLRRIGGWLEAGGCALVDVLTPWHWANASGRVERWDDVQNRFGFEAEGCRMTDTLWRDGDEANAVTQTLRCYSPADLRLLLEGTGLRLTAIESFEDESYETPVPLERAMLYLAKMELVSGEGESR